MSLRRRCCKSSNRAEPTSAVLVSFNRLRECRLVEEYLVSTNLFSEILVWTNTTDENRMLYGRYIASASASSEIIYTQDDDCIVENIAELLNGFDGEHLISAMKKSAVKRYETARYGDAHVTLLGWGAVFKREWIAVLNLYLHQFGENFLLKREADRIFTILLNRPHHSVPACINEFQCASSLDALWRDPEHEKFYGDAVRQALTLLGKSEADGLRTP